MSRLENFTYRTPSGGKESLQVGTEEAADILTSDTGSSQGKICIKKPNSKAEDSKCKKRYPRLDITPALFRIGNS